MGTTAKVYDTVEVHWQYMSWRDAEKEVEEEDTYYFDSTGGYSDVTDLHNLDVVKVTITSMGSVIQYIHGKGGIGEMFEEISKVMYRKIKKVMDASPLSRTLLGTKTDGELRLVYSYISYPSHHPLDPPEYDEEFKFVCFLDDAMRSIGDLVKHFGVRI